MRPIDSTEVKNGKAYFLNSLFAIVCGSLASLVCCCLFPLCLKCGLLCPGPACEDAVKLTYYIQLALMCVAALVMIKPFQFFWEQASSLLKLQRKLVEFDK
jgi:hypothetical protein